MDGLAPKNTGHEFQDYSKLYQVPPPQPFKAFLEWARETPMQDEQNSKDATWTTTWNKLWPFIFDTDKRVRLIV